jgi:hypothetical protein
MGWQRFAPEFVERFHSKVETLKKTPTWLYAIWVVKY